MLIDSLLKIPWNPATGLHPKDTWKHAFGTQTASNFHITTPGKKHFEKAAVTFLFNLQTQYTQKNSQNKKREIVKHYSI